MTPTIIFNNRVKNTTKIPLCLTVVILSFNFILQTFRDGKRVVQNFIHFCSKTVCNLVNKYRRFGDHPNAMVFLKRIYLKEVIPNMFLRNAGRYVVNYKALNARCICSVSITCFVRFSVMSSVLKPSCCRHYI